MTGPQAGPTGDPFDHNGECRYCDELAGHRADCPWLLALLAEYDRLRAQVQHLTILLSERQEHQEAQAAQWPRQLGTALSEDRCRVCGTLIGIGVPLLHLGLCEVCSGPTPPEEG